MSEEIKEENGDCGAVPELVAEKRVGCAHYKRRAKFVVSETPSQTILYQYSMCCFTRNCVPGSKHPGLNINVHGVEIS